MAKYLIAEEGLLQGLILTLDEKVEYKIGRDHDQVDLILDDPSVSRKHALIFKEDDGFCITDLSHTNPTFVNDETIVNTHLLKNGDIVKIGKTTFKYTDKKPENLPQDTKPQIDNEEPNETIVGNEEIIEEEPPEEIEETHETIINNNNDQMEEENLETIEDHPELHDDTPYDTIFEDETEEELPFNLISDSGFILKVMSGSNAGAEFAMEKEHSYIIGKDPHICDIAFNDLSVSKEHAKVSIDEDGNSYIEDLGSRNGIIVNSRKITNKVKISSNDLIVVGSTTFVVLDPSEAQETIYSISPSIEEEIELESSEEENEIDVTAKKISDWRKLIIPQKHLIIAGSIVTILFVMFLSFFSLFKSEKIEIKQKTPTDDIQKALDKFSDIKFSYNPASGKLFLVGHVLTSVDQQELTYNIDAIGFVENVENNIVIDEYVWKNINDLLNDNTAWRSVSMHSPEAGKFVVNGYVDNANELERISDYLNANFPYIDKMENKIVMENVLKTEIEGLIISKGLSTISYQLASGEVILAGRYGKEDTKSYEKLLESLKKVEGVRSVKNAAIKTTADMARINLSQKYNISGIATTDDNDITSVIANNKLININGFLDGMKVTEIKSNTIYLEKDGLKYKIDYIR